MTETEKLLLDALQSLETNRKQTEKLMLNALEKLQQKVTSLEQENERLTKQQQQLSEAWQAVDDIRILDMDWNPKKGKEFPFEEFAPIHMAEFFKKTKQNKHFGIFIVTGIQTLNFPRLIHKITWIDLIVL